jgi:hypothetical protein
MTYHFVNKCSAKRFVLGMGNPPWQQGQHNFSNGKVNHMTSEEVQQA